MNVVCIDWKSEKCVTNIMKVFKFIPNVTVGVPRTNDECYSVCRIKYLFDNKVKKMSVKES